jgi:hypothetical protein
MSVFLIFIHLPPRGKVWRATERFMSLLVELIKFSRTGCQFSLGKILDQAMVVAGPYRQDNLEIFSLIVLTSKTFLTEDTESQCIISISGGYSDGVSFRLVDGSTSKNISWKSTVSWHKDVKVKYSCIKHINHHWHTDVAWFFL